MAIKVGGTTVIGDSYTLENLGNSANFLANTANKALTTTNVWGSQGAVTLTDAATIAVDLSTGINFEVTLAGNRALGNPTNAKAGQRGRIKVIQDATGSRTLSYGTSWEFATGTAYTLASSASGEYDILYYDVISSTSIIISALGNVS